MSLNNIQNGEPFGEIGEFALSKSKRSFCTFNRH
jgi:hypothetical protein